MGVKWELAASLGGVGWVYIDPITKLAIVVQKLAVMTCTGEALLQKFTALPQLPETTHAAHRKRHNFLLQTSFLVILDFLERLFQGLSSPAKSKPQNQ